MALDQSQFYTDPATGTTYTSKAVFDQYNPTGVGGAPGTPGGADISQASKAISLDQLNPVSPITLPTPPPAVNSLDAVAEGAKATSKSLADYIKELTPPESDTSKQYDKLSADISSLLPGLTGQGAAQVEAEQAAGLPDMKKKLSDINAQLLTAVAEATKTNTSYEQLIANLENPNNAQQQGIPMAAIIGQQAQVKKMQLAEANSKAANIGLLQAYALGLQGQVQAAQSAVDRAIDLKYQDKLAEVDLKMKQLELLEGKLNKEEEITKQALLNKYNDEKEKIAEEKQKAKDNITLAFAANVQTKFVNKMGEFYMAQTGQGFATPEEFFKAAGVKSFDEAYKKGLVTDVNASKLADIEFATQARNKYWDAGINITDSPSTVKAKIAGSKIYQDDTSESPSGLTTYQMQQALNAISDDYRQDPAVKDFAVAASGYDFLKNINPDSKNPADNIGAIYAFAKIMDPNSVVREGEYATVQKYAQSWAETFGFNVNRIFTGSEFLSSQAIKNMQATAGSKYTALENAYIQVKSAFEQRKTDLLSGKINTTLPEYGLTPTIGGGGIIEYNGKTYEVDANGNFDPNKPVTYGPDTPSLEKTMAAIGQYESGGNYKAVGPVTKSGDKAYGKYQVMGANIPSWTKAALGKSLTPQQFLNDPKAQDAVAKHKMGEYLNKYGTVENVAIAWFAGPGAVGKNNTGKKDVIGTSVPKYIQNILAIYNKA